MPDKMPRTKKAKAAAVGQTMHEFKHGTLHSGSKSGPKVENRKQAIAIAMSQSGQSKSAKQPHPKTNPGDYDNEAHPRAEYKKPGETFRPGADAVAEQAAASNRNKRLDGVGMQPVVPMRHAPPLNAHGFGHSGSQRSGALRLSGVRGAHRIGAK